MIKSMTGFGKGEAGDKCGRMKVEVRSVNHKFLELSIKLPEGLTGFEDRIREMTARFVRRGKVNLNLTYEDSLTSADKIAVDERLAKVYYKLLTGLKRKLHLEGTIRLDQLITLPGVITYEHRGELPRNIWPCIEKALRGVFRDLDESRLKEGRHLYVDIKRRIGTIKKAAAIINERSRINVRLYKERLKNTIRELTDDTSKTFDRGRLEQEVALYAKNSDVTEEIIRIAAHVKNLDDCLRHETELGKKIDFIAQELNREVNTIGSKAGDFKISQKVIQLKGEVEKLREQAKNIE